jgi:short-subunit dehydrogenase
MIEATPVIVITGASDGIGAEMARQLAPRRVHLVLAARNAAKLEQVAAACTAAGAEVLTVPTDVAQEADCRRLIEQAMARFGRIDVLVANAGISMHAAFVAITDWSTYEQLWRINCLGTIHCVRFAWPHLRASRGQVVGVSSLAGRTGIPERTTYCASKFAQTGFLEALRIEAEPLGIAVTVAYPGVVATEIRRHGLNGDGQTAGVSGLNETGAMPVEVCAQHIIRTMDARRREVVMTAKGRIGLWLKMVAPALVDRIARGALAREGR